MKKILITGGAGYIGSKLATELLNYNYNVTVIPQLLCFTAPCIIKMYVLGDNKKLS